MIANLLRVLVLSGLHARRSGGCTLSQMIAFQQCSRAGQNNFVCRALHSAHTSVMVGFRDVPRN